MYLINSTENLLKQDKWNVSYYLSSYLRLSHVLPVFLRTLLYLLPRIFPLLNLLGQKDQRVKLGPRRDVKNRMGVATVGCGSLGLNDSIFLVPLNERDREMVNLRSFTIFSQIKGNSFIHVWWSLSSSITVLLKVFQHVVFSCIMSHSWKSSLIWIFFFT